jgi:hypothetical protein
MSERKPPSPPTAAPRDGASRRDLLLRGSALAAASAAVSLTTPVLGQNAPEKPEISSVKQIPYGLHGYLAADLSPPSGYGFGASFYVTVWALLESPLGEFTVGQPSTWIKPENFDFKLPLCPIGTFPRDEAQREKENENLPRDWIEQEKLFFRDVFQTLEGGLGFWGSTQFPTKSPKYRINGVPDCYTTPIGSPGWPFGEPKALADQAMGLAQLSNRILVPPDGIPFAARSEAELSRMTELLGVAWMALPFTDYDGYFHLQTKQSASENDQASLYWQSDSQGGLNSAFLRPASDNAKHQLWKLVPSDRNGYFYLTTLEAQGGVPNGPITHFGKSDDKLWKMVPAAEDYYYLQTSQSEARKECLDGKKDGVHMAPRSIADTQLWRLVPQAVGNDVATGDSSWTLFLNSENFKGPVVFFPPTTWSRISKQNLPAVGRGLDARMGLMGSAAMEFATVPGLQASYGGKTYLRIPKLLFPTQPHDTAAPQLVTPLMQDITLYSREAIYAPVMSWFANGPEAFGQFAAQGAIENRLQKGAPIAFDQGGNKLQGISDLVEITNLAILGDRTDCSWGLVWKVPPRGSGFLTGQFPEYFVDGVAAPASSIPAETGLATATFTPPGAGKSYISPTSGAWTSPGPAPGPAGGPLTVTLGDGTKVTYAWYRFVDQPALQNLDLTPEQKSKLQSRIELLHKNWTIGHDYIAKPPRVINLVKVDPKLIVTPPSGLEVGYVPIVTKQELA